MKVLIVDDEPVILASTRKILSAESFEVVTAPDGEAAVALLAAEAPDIVITDLVLPGISGMTFIESALEHNPGLVVILTTGYSTVENAVAALKHGAFEFLPKPFTCDELVASVTRARQAVESRRTAS